MPQPSRDFHLKLREQLEFIESSCAAYDQGRIAEAIRIATALRIIFYDYRQSVSILNHLNETTRVRMLTTAEGIDEKGASVITSITWSTFSGRDDNHYYEPVLAKSTVRNLVAFDQWWTRDKIFLIGPSVGVNRRQLVLDVTNKDGGAHVDADLTAEHHTLNAGAGVRAEVFDGRRTIIEPIKWAAEATLRQIGWEVLHTPDLRRLARLNPIPIELTGIEIP